MPATAEYLSVHPFASPDIVNPPEAPTYRYRPDIETLVDFAAVETVDLSAGSRIDIIVDGALLTYVLQAGIPTGGALEIIPDDYDVSLNQQFWLLVASGNASLGVLDFTDIGGTISIDQLPPGSIVTVDSIGENALYFFTDSTSLPSLLGAVDVKTFLDINFSDLSGTIALDQFPSGTVTTLDSIDEDGLYFFDNDTFTPSLISKLDALIFLLPDQTGEDGNFLQTNAGVLSWAAASGGSAWGDLTGTLSDQTDLQSALDAKQPLDSDLTTLAGLTATTDNFIVSVSSAWSSRTPSQVRTTLGLVIGTNVQAFDADLSAVAALTTDAFGLQLLTKTSAANIRTYIGAGTSSFDGAFSSLTGTPTTLSGYGITDAQPLDSDLTTIAGLTATTDNFIVSVSSTWASRTPTQVKTTLGLTIGTNVQAWDADLDTLASLTATTDNFIVSVSSAWSSRTPAQVRTTLGLVIGTNVQAWDADLDTLAGLTATTDNFIVSVSSAWASRTPAQVLATLAAVGTTFQPLDSDLTTLAGLTATTDNFIVSVSSAWASRTPSQVRTTLGLVIGTNVQAWDADLDTLAGLTATTDNFVVSVSSAWASRTPTQVKTTLGLTIGTNIQAWDADLDTIAALTATTDNFIVSVSSAWSSRTPSQVRTTLGLVIGTNVQAWDADLDSWAGVTRASGFDTFAATPSSANLRALTTDENGTGACLFDSCTSATFITPLLGTPTSGDLRNCSAATDSIAGVMSAADHTTLTALSGQTSGTAPSFVAVGMPVIAYKTGVDIKTNAATDIFTVPASRSFNAISAQVVVTAVTAGAAVSYVSTIRESGGNTVIVAATSQGSVTPSVGKIYTNNNSTGTASLVVTTGNKVQINVTTGFTTSTTVTATVFVFGYYSV